MNSIKIAIMDDHVLVRKGLYNLLNQYCDFNIVLETSSENELVDFVKNNPLDIILLDISMPCCNGLDILPKLIRLNKALKVIMLTFSKDEKVIYEAVQNGASAYLLKDSEPDELETAIRTVYEGGKYFNTFISNILIDTVGKPIKIEALSKRENEMLQYLSRGFTTKQIAEDLGISCRTIESHRAQLMKKIKAGNSAELIRKAIENRLIS